MMSRLAVDIEVLVRVGEIVPITQFLRQPVFSRSEWRALYLSSTADVDVREITLRFLELDMSGTAEAGGFRSVEKRVLLSGCLSKTVFFWLLKVELPCFMSYSSAEPRYF